MKVDRIRTPVLAGLGIAAAAAITAAVTIGVESARESIGPDVNLVADLLYDECQSVPVFAEPTNPSAVPIGGGVDTPARILIQGMTAADVIVDRFEVLLVSRSTENLKAVGVPVYCQGDLVPRNLRVDLDDEDPRLRPTGDAKSLPVTVSQDDPEQFIIRAETEDDVEWRVKINFIVNGEVRAVTVPESGSFRTISQRLFSLRQGTQPGD